MSIKKVFRKLVTIIHSKARTFFSLISPIEASKVRYKKIFHRNLNLCNPTSLNEKLMYLKLFKYWKNKAVTQCADKYAVREYINKLGCPELLNTIYGAWEKVEDIDWDCLPEKFVIKCNHGSGYNIVCKNKSEFNIDEAKKRLKGWMKQRYGAEYIEYGIYSKIKRMIIAERFIDTSDGLPPKDYKFFCSYGKVKMLFLATDRFEDQTKFDYYWPDWEHIPVKNYFQNNGPIKKPKNLDKMIKYAEKLSKGFPLVRVDFYNEGDSIIFGELTFTHFGCLNTFEPDEYDYHFGSLFPTVEELKQWKGIDEFGNPIL